MTGNPKPPQTSYKSYSSPRIVAKRLELLRAYTTSRLLCRPDMSLIARQLDLVENEMRRRKLDFQSADLALKQHPTGETS